MNPLRPVDPGYDPGYPRRLTEPELRALLRRSLLERFSGATLLSGALLAGCLPQVLAQEPASRPQPGRLPRSPQMAQPAFAKELSALLADVLGKSKGGFWDQSASIVLSRPLPANPPVKSPQIRISFGNSHVGVFDVEAARAATRRLFAHYGIELQRDVPVTGDGYRFVADGFDPVRKVGFKITVPAGPVGLGGGDSQVQPPEPPERALDLEELARVDRDVAAGTLRLFVVHASAYPNMDQDLYTPMQYYLASVVDYLNWVHGEEHLDLDTVLGRLPGWARVAGAAEPPYLPGGGFTDERDLRHWQLTNARAGRTERWCEKGGFALRLELGPGGEARYVVPADVTLQLDGNRNVMTFKLHVEPAAAKDLVVEALDARGQALTLAGHTQGVSRSFYVPDPKPVRIHALRLRWTGTTPTTVYVRELRW